MITIFTKNDGKKIGVCVDAVFYVEDAGHCRIIATATHEIEVAEPLGVVISQINKERERMHTIKNIMN